MSKWSIWDKQAICVCVCVCVYIFVLYHVTCQCSVPPHFPVNGTGIVPCHLPVQCATSFPSTWYWYCTMSLASAVCHLISQYMVLVLYHVTRQCSVPPQFQIHGIPCIIVCSHVRSTSCLIFEKISLQTLASVLSNWSFKLQVHWPYCVKRGTITCNLDGYTLILHEYQTLWDFRSSKCCG
jgi:hypothetical protein